MSLLDPKACQIHAATWTIPRNNFENLVQTSICFTEHNGVTDLKDKTVIGLGSDKNLN